MNNAFFKFGLFISMIGSVSTSAQMVPLSAPAQIEASDGAFADRIEVKWSNVGADVAYNIWRNDKPDAASARIIRHNYQVNIFADQNAGDQRTLIPGKKYYYWVESLRGNLKSNLSRDDDGSLFTYALPSTSSGQKGAQPGGESGRTGLWISNDSFLISTTESLSVSFEAHNLGKIPENLRIHFFISKDALLDVLDEQMAELADVKVAPNGELKSTVVLKPGFSPRKGRVYLIMTSTATNDPRPKVVSVRPVIIR